ncbi:hypothetical protein PAPYR_11899 [Paratrimastix pyriformis]|uniref:Uncharacterized protein n=1 Tax=Paratrimastix pyriformis TaxID=342808 RepID=A0ABQ8U2U4_9EUKA|nr:hypothetical protein PAPYR_11899 [Paratrimastix pyriformis]
MPIFLANPCFLLFWYSPILGQQYGEVRSPSSLSGTEKRIALKQIELSGESMRLGYCRLELSGGVLTKSGDSFPSEFDVSEKVHRIQLFSVEHPDQYHRIMSTVNPDTVSSMSSNQMQVENSPIAVNAAQVDNGSTSIIDNGAYEGADEGAYEFNVDLLLRAVNILESTLFGAKITLKKFTARVTCPAAVEDAINLMKLGVQSLTELCHAAARMDNDALEAACKVVKGMQDLIEQETRSTTADLFNERPKRRVHRDSDDFDARAYAAEGRRRPVERRRRAADEGSDHAAEGDHA